MFAGLLTRYLGANSANNDDSRTPLWSADREFARLMLAALCIFAITAIGAVIACEGRGGWVAFGIVLVVMTTAGIAGAAVGFLFGIPRLLANRGSVALNGSTTTSPVSNADAHPDLTQSRYLSSNSNLEEVSDWLTKIILGVGLTQVWQLNDRLLQFEQTIGHYTPRDAPALPLIATIALLFSFICGFLAMYLETRLVLSRIFNTVEAALANAEQAAATATERATKAEGVVSELTGVVAQVAADPARAKAGLAASADTLKSIADADGSAIIRSVAGKAMAFAGRASEGAEMAADDTVSGRINSMVIALYQERPQGYTAALRIAGSLSTSAEAKKRADYWFYQMAAFGQKHCDLINNNGNDQDIRSARDNALDCAHQCMKIDSSFRIRIYWLMHPETSPTPEDDDLKTLSGDPDFEALVGPPAL